MSQIIKVPQEHLRAIYDLAVNSLDFGSSFWDNEETDAARAVAELLGLDPMEATPHDLRRAYGHPFVPAETRRRGGVVVCERCLDPAEARQHAGPVGYLGDTAEQT